MSTQKPTLIKFDVCLYKSDSVSHEEFAKYLLDVYAPKAIPIMKKYGLVQWSTTMYPPEARVEQREVTKELGRHEWTVPDYDVTMSYWLRSMNDMRTLAMSPEWAELEAEAQPYANMTIGHFLVGQQIVHFGSEEANGHGAATA